MTTEQIRDYLEKQLFIENTVVRELASPKNIHRRTPGLYVIGHLPALESRVWDPCE